MSHIYTQERISSGSNLSALGIGALGVVSIFALLPILMEIPNPFDKPQIKPAEDVTVQLPDMVIEEPPAVIEDPKEIDKPELEETPPLVNLKQMESLLNPSDNGTGVTVDDGTTFLNGDDIAIGTFVMSQLDQKPRVLVATTPLYPYSMQNSKTKGEVTVEFIIDENGRVSRPRVIKSSHREFEQAAIDAVMKSKWQPGRKDGRDVRTIVHLPVNFRP